MPYRVRKIDPIDLDERKAIGLKLPFSSPSVFTSTYQTVDAYKSNILNFLLTAKKERYFNVTFGNSLLNQLFEHYTENKKTLIEQQIRTELSYYFPKLNIPKLEILGNPDTNTVQLVIEFEIKGTELSDELVINIE